VLGDSVGDIVFLKLEHEDEGLCQFRFFGDLRRISQHQPKFDIKF